MKKTKIKNDLTEAISLSSKINNLLTDHHDECWSIKNKGHGDYLLLNAKLIKKVEKVIRGYRMITEKYGK